jgi:hypothetical protein
MRGRVFDITVSKGEGLRLIDFGRLKGFRLFDDGECAHRILLASN